MKAKRGRPPKEKFLVPMAIHDPVTPAESTLLRTKVLSLPCVGALPANQQEGLVNRLIDDLDAFKLAKIVNTKRRSSQGNKAKADLSLLIFKCAVSWCNTLGIEKTSLWESLNNTRTAKEAPSVELARSCIEVATGKPYPTSLRQQFKGAKKWFIMPVAD